MYRPLYIRPTMSEHPCSTTCDYNDCQILINRFETHPTIGVGLTVLYWGVYCNTWHTMIINSIGSAYPSHFTHFDRQTPLTGAYPSSGYYITGNSIEIPRPSPPGNMSGYVFCYVPQDTLQDKDINTGLTSRICNNIHLWYGPVIIFATDPINRVRRVQSDDANIVTDTIRQCVFPFCSKQLTDNKRFIRTNAFPFRSTYTPYIHTASIETDLHGTPQVLLTTLSTAPLSALLEISSTNKTLTMCVREVLRRRVNAVVSYYLPERAKHFIKLVGQLQGVFTGYAVLDFVNGKWENFQTERPQCYPLELVMDNLAVEKALAFFIDMNDDTVPITIDTNPDPLLRSTCPRVVEIGHQDVSNSIKDN